jgi:hypothetical protein
MVLPIAASQVARAVLEGPYWRHWDSLSAMLGSPGRAGMQVDTMGLMGGPGMGVLGWDPSSPDLKQWSQ